MMLVPSVLLEVYLDGDFSAFLGSNDSEHERDAFVLTANMREKFLKLNLNILEETICSTEEILPM